MMLRSLSLALASALLVASGSAFAPASMASQRTASMALNAAILGICVLGFLGWFFSTFFWDMTEQVAWIWISIADLHVFNESWKKDGNANSLAMVQP